MKGGFELGPRDDAAMSFVEIARALGYRDPEGAGAKAVWTLYHVGMNKLRSRPGLMRKLKGLAEARRQVIAERGVAPEFWEE